MVRKSQFEPWSKRTRELKLLRQIPGEDRFFLNDDVTDSRLIEGWCQTIDHDRILPLLIEVDGRIVADATLHQRKLGWMAHVAGVRVIVSPTHRNKGLAVRTVRGLIQIAQNSGLNKLETEFIP